MKRNQLIAVLLLSGMILFFHSCSVNNVKQDDSLKKFFDEQKTEGCFAMFDNSRGEFTIYNLRRDTLRYTPASTFKIVNALIAIQTGRILDEKTIIPWDGVTRERKEWNQDLTLEQAFRYSSVPHFREIARRIGKDTMKIWIDSLKYGNMNMGNTVDSFWLDNSIKISPDEQLGLVKKLYFRQLPFRDSVQAKLKKMMIQENNTQYQLAYKTGWGFTENGNALGWIVGWIEENRHVYPFVLNIESADHNADIPAIRKIIMENILKKLGFFEGKM
ncbi:MAG: class D beta-lactamase [Chitinophagaceae bacterium]|nr:class D beta-lactamase [Chitinophagaceae bacterium]